MLVTVLVEFAAVPLVLLALLMVLMLLVLELPTVIAGSI